MKVLKKLGIITLALVGIAILGLACFAGTMTKQFNPLDKDAIVSGIHLSDLSRPELLAITHDPAETTITVAGKGYPVETFEGGDVLANPLEDEAFKETIKRRALSLGSDIGALSPLSSKEDDNGIMHLNKKGLDATMGQLAAVQNENPIPTEDATGKYDKSSGKFVPIPEKVGTKVDTTLLANKIQQRLQEAQDGSDQGINLYVDKIYENPKVVMGSPEQLRRINLLNNALRSQINYNYGSNSTAITGDTFGSWIKTDNTGTIVMNNGEYANYMQEVASTNNIYQSKEEAMKKKQVMTGHLINYNDEYNVAVDTIRKNSSVTRDLPEFSVTSDDVAAEVTLENQPRLDQLRAQLGPEFVYINLPQQFLWFYKDNNLVVATPVTTGARGSHDTPTGQYKIEYKDTNVVLSDGKTYWSPVVYWLPFNGGIGIHDADNWRSSYGGDIYTYNGSHGCVNTPREKVQIIYDNIDEGCPVYVE